MSRRATGRRRKLTAQAFDVEGFYLIGDAVTFADPARPELGLFFDGRVAEDFKLNSGTWVNVGHLRVAGIAALAPLAQDIVVTGHGGDEVRFLVFPNIAACRAYAGLPDSAEVKDVIDHDKVRAGIAQRLAKLRRKAATRPLTRRARCCWRNRLPSMAARSPTRAISTSARC